MEYIKHKLTKTVKWKENEFELTPLVESTAKPAVRRIARCPTKVIRESAEEGRQVNEAGETSSQPRLSGGNHKAVLKLEEALPRFGPLYSLDQPSVQATKEKAWDHVLQRSPEKDSQVTIEIYLKSIRPVEQAAKEKYADKGLGIGSNFRWMMIKDGCFFLQLTLLILGCSEQLGYPQNDPIFGKKHNKKDLKKWIQAMFFVGNQIPLVVLNQLMNQNFFQDVIKRRRWDPQPSGLYTKLLFELLVLPALERNQNNLMLIMMGPSDLLHGLQNLLIGPGPPSEVSGDQYEAEDEIDLEANEDDDYERILPSAIDEDSDGTSFPRDNADKLRRFLSAIGLSNVVDNQNRIFPCATDLERAGISIKKLKNGGARSIGFKSYYFWAFLYLPAFPELDDNAEMIFQNLKTYEISQQMTKHKREASAYLRFMSDIIQTTKDVKLLKKKGIIQGSSVHAEKLPGILSRLNFEDVRLTYEFHILRRKISDYSSPWVHYKGVINLVVFLTLLQTCFALLAYFRPPKP